MHLATAFPTLFAELEMAGFSSFEPLSGDCGGELSIDFNCVGGAGADCNGLVEHCGVALVDFGLPWNFVSGEQRDWGGRGLQVVVPDERSAVGARRYYGRRNDEFVFTVTRRDPWCKESGLEASVHNDRGTSSYGAS
jgi:hypothetical protein